MLAHPKRVQRYRLLDRAAVYLKKGVYGELRFGLDSDLLCWMLTNHSTPQSKTPDCKYTFLLNTEVIQLVSTETSRAPAVDAPENHSQFVSGL